MASWPWLHRWLSCLLRHGTPAGSLGARPTCAAPAGPPGWTRWPRAVPAAAAPPSHTEGRGFRCLGCPATGHGTQGTGDGGRIKGELACSGSQHVGRVLGSRPARAPAPPLGSLWGELTTRGVEGQARREPPSSAGLHSALGDRNGQSTACVLEKRGQSRGGAGMPMRVMGSRIRGSCTGQCCPAHAQSLPAKGGTEPWERTPLVCPWAREGVLEDPREDGQGGPYT